MVATWTKSKPILQNTLPKLQDDNVREDSLTSQSIFDQDINSDGYLNSLIPLECFLTIERHADLQEIYMVYASQFMMYISSWGPMTPSLALTKTNP